MEISVRFYEKYAELTVKYQNVTVETGFLDCGEQLALAYDLIAAASELIYHAKEHLKK